MATLGTYKVSKKTGVDKYSGPGTSYNKIGGYSFNKELTVYEKKAETGKSTTWAAVDKSKKAWVNFAYLEKVQELQTPNLENTDKAKSVAVNNGDEDIYKGTYLGNKKMYNKMIDSYARAFGAPFTFLEETDPYYSTGVGKTIGRTMASTMYSAPMIFSICPGTVDYLPGFSKKNKDKFFNQAVKAASGDSSLTKLLKGNNEDKLSGKMYEFKSSYKEYINIVNAMCRTSAILMGIGNEKMPGSSTKLKNFDYGYFTTPSSKASNGASGTKKSNSIFAEAKKALNTAVSDESYIHFFLTHQGSAVSENINTSTTSSALEEAFNESGLSSAAKNLQYMMGGAIGSAEDDIQRIIDDSYSSSEFLGNFASMTKNYIKGGRIVFPQMIDSVGYDKAVTATLKFFALTGDKVDIFLRTMVPTIHVMALAFPKQIGQSMYTYPFLCRVYQPGWYNSDLSVITNLRITRGGTDDTSWTVDALSREIELSFDITPLYSNMMVTASNHPFLFMQNTALLEYLGVMCGVDLKMNNFNAKVDIMKSLVKNKFTDIPTNLARGIVDSKIVDYVKKSATFIN